jgi:hypothetical protein
MGDSHRSHVRGSNGVTHDVRIWRTSTAACRAVMFDPPEDSHVLSIERLGFRLILKGQVVDDPVDCMTCLATRRTPYAVLCDDHGQQFLTEKEYDYHMRRLDTLWKCPRCGESAYWDDDEYEANLDEGPDDDEADRQAT